MEDRGPIVAVLGPCRIVAEFDDTAPPVVDLSLIQRKVLERLALAGTAPVDVDQLAEAVWGDDPPATARTAIHNQISRIRRRVDQDLLRTEAGRYSLSVPTDIDMVESALLLAERSLAAGDPDDALRRTRTALDAWRGLPFEELSDLADVQSARRHLAEVRRSLENLRLRAALEVGHLAWALPEAERLVAAAPHDEHRWVLLMRALDAGGRRGDALGAYERARRSLAEHLGLEPGPDLRAAEAAILADVADGTRHRSSPFVGRTSLVHEILGRLDRDGIAVLTGETGIGKSRLLLDATRRARRSGTTVTSWSCSANPDTAITTLVELAAGLGTDLDRSVPPMLAFRSAVASSLDEGRRVLLAVDDVDRAGPTSIAALLDAAQLDGVSLLAAVGDEDLVPDAIDDAARVAVGPFDESEVRELVRSLEVTESGIGADRVDGTGDMTDDATLRWLVAMSGGNPTLVEHLLDERADRAGRAGLPDEVDPLPGSGGSTALRVVVRTRVGRLGATTRSTLEVAAVCGHSFPASLLDRLAPGRGRTGAVAAGLLDEGVGDDGTPWLSFRHGAVREILYDDLPPGRRMELHHHVAATLDEQEAPAPSVAAHALEAVEVAPSSAARHAIAAARGAGADGAHADAAQWFERAALAAESAGDGATLRVEALIGRGDSLRLAGSGEQEAALFDAADAALALGEPTLVGDAAFAVLQLGATTESGSIHERAIELADFALLVVEDHDQRAQIAAAASLTHSMTGASRRCRDLFVEAVGGARSDATRRNVLPFAYLALGHPVDLELREELTLELRARAEAADDPVALFEAHQLAFSVALQRADGAAVRAALAASEALVDRVGDVGRRWALAYQRAAVAHLDDQLDLAERHAEEALAIFASVSPSRAFATYGGQLLPLRMAQGRLGDLLETLEELVAEQPGVPAWNAALALALVEVGSIDRAVGHARAALDDVDEDFTWLAAHLVGGRAAAGCGDEPLMVRYRELLEPWAGLVCWQGTCSYGPVDSVLSSLHAALGDEAAAERHRRVALELSMSLAAPVFAAELQLR